MIKFIEHASSQYPPRTYENASADATIAFAFNFNSPGENLTRVAVASQQKKYIAIPPFFSSSDIDRAMRVLNSINAKTINIAGNGAYIAIKYGADQSRCDTIVFNFLNLLIRRAELNNQIILIRSGGQSGFDEAGLKAAVNLNIPALCVCPHSWKFKDINGITHCDEQLFKNRFPSEYII